MGVKENLAALGLRLPAVAKPVAAYVPCVRAGNMVYVAGQIPVVEGELKYKGKVGGEVSLEDAQEAARICTLNALAAVEAEIGDLDKVERVTRVTAFVASTDDFTGQAQVANGASELIDRVFGEKGAHSRMALGTNVLPLDCAVEIAFDFLISE